MLLCSGWKACMCGKQMSPTLSVTERRKHVVAYNLVKHCCNTGTAVVLRSPG